MSIKHPQKLIKNERFQDQIVYIHYSLQNTRIIPHFDQNYLELFLPGTFFFKGTKRFLQIIV